MPREHLRKMPQLELTGHRSGKLVAIERVGPNPKGRILWRCRCDCGKEAIVIASSIKLGRSRSCGCVPGGRPGLPKESHLLSKTKEYHLWANMRDRCSNPKSPTFKYYGARGISVCASWIGVHGFETFMSEMGPRPDGYSIDRIDPNRNYEKSNCRWATAAEQARNRRNNKFYSIGGESMIVRDWAARYGMSYSTVYSRIRRGWSLEAALGKVGAQ